MTRAAMLMLALLAMHFLLGVLVLAVARGERKSPALRLWGWGLLAYAVGALFFVVPGPVSVDIRQVVGNVLISLAALLTALAVYAHTPLRLSRSVIFGSLGAVSLVLLLNHLVSNSILIIDIATPTVYATLLYLVVSVLLLLRPPAAAKNAARFLVLTIVATLVVWNLRLWAIWDSLGGTQDPGRADFAVSVSAIGQMLLLVSSTLGLLWIEVRLMEHDLERAAYTDLLTGLPNRRAMMRRFDEEVARSKRQQQKFAMAVYDIDHFKQINDTCGHHVGDAVLKHIAESLAAGKRAEDVLGRIGGEEFLVLLPHHERERSLVAAERLRRAVEAAQSHQDVVTPAATVSGGVAVYPEDGDDWDRLFTAADRRMYRAKHAGRNRVVGDDANGIH